jgi:hypothetical protein
VTDTDLALAEPTLDEHLNLRRLPPVEPVAAPERLSQTLLNKANSCQRSAYLYVRHHGGMPGHQLDRGAALHIAQAKATNLILERHALDAGADGDVDYAVDEHTAKLMLDETFAEHPELTVPLHERDQLRVMMVHLSQGFPINPAKIVAVERKFLLRLGDYVVSGILDLAMIDGPHGEVHDYKSTWDVPSQQEYEATFQGRLYAVALIYGHPVTRLPCHNCEVLGAAGPDAPDDCPVCGGRGYLEQLDAPLGEQLQTVTVGEVFPRFLQEDGTVPTRTMPLSRIEIDALRRDIEAQCAQLMQAFETSEFPAVSGSHCQECPCEPECPLPRHLRNFAGAIQTEDEAREAMEWHERVAPKVAATKAEVKSFCKANGPLRVGANLVAEFGEVTRWDTNWGAIESGAVRAAQYGEPFDITQHRRQKLGTAFRVRKLTETELAAEREQEA